MNWLAPCLLIALAACETLPAAPVVSVTFAKSYDQLAACTYERIRADGSANDVHLTDLRANRTIVINKGDAIPIWEARFTAAGSGTRVDVKAAPTIWGSDLHANRMMPHVRACAS